MYLSHHSILSPFRREKLLALAQKQIPSLTALEARHLYFAVTKQPLTQREDIKLRALLPEVTEHCQTIEGHYLLVVPRTGTISPWSSKATEIAILCGFAPVERLERGVLWQFTGNQSLEELKKLSPWLHDRMTETVFTQMIEVEKLLFPTLHQQRPLRTVEVLTNGKAALLAANQTQGLALSAEEMDYLMTHFTAWQRNPTDVELMMFAQANSEHCRHKIFNAEWVIDGHSQPTSLFAMIQQTFAQHPGKVISAYHDNAAVMRGFLAQRLLVETFTHQYRYFVEETAILMKVETHNHPTAISPFPGAATGSGGEIRDEGATGRGAKPKAGLTGFSVSNLRIPEFLQPWELEYGTPPRMATALQIMLEGPLGASAFNNEFGRPALCGYFRTFEQSVNGQQRGYHKPIMLAGGIGTIRLLQVEKTPFPPTSLLIVLGGPAMLIGLGGGAASSVSAGDSSEELDFASVQRGNPEMQRRCQEVIDACWQLGTDNPILSIHDVGAGGLSNALPELVHGAGCGGLIHLAAIPTADPDLSPMEIWCNEAQERYVLAIAKEQLPLFASFCERERCPYAVVGEATAARELKVYKPLLIDKERNQPPLNPLLDEVAIDMPLSVLLGKPPKMRREVQHLTPLLFPLDMTEIRLSEAALRVLRLPTVANKSFLITIGDRSVGGLVARDQMVGPWQVPVADCAVTASGFHEITGEAMAIGERTPLALVNAPASGRMAVGEALTNLASACIEQMSDIALSANWMAACGQAGEDAQLFDTVKAVSELCIALGLVIPVGKDSLSMKTTWDDKAVIAPISLIISAFARVSNIHATLTPVLQSGATALLLIDLGNGKSRLGGSALAQVYNQLGNTPPDVEDPQALIDFFHAIQTLNLQRKILAYHDRSDGGLFVTLCEMAFASHCGLDIHLDGLAAYPLANLFTEELGAVIQVKQEAVSEVIQFFQEHTACKQVHWIGMPTAQDTLNFYHRGKSLLELPRTTLQRAWSETSYHLQKLRDNPHGAQQEFDSLLDTHDCGLTLHCTFTLQPPTFNTERPRLAILRDQGVNGQQEMAAAFHHAGFNCIDVHMSDILTGRVTLKNFQGFVACGGFSYGDVLGAGSGWAKSILYNSRAFDEFSAFFQRPDTFALGVCNGCQMMAQLRDLIPGATHWPRFVRNESEQFEARLVMVEVLDSPSLFLQGMAGSRLPIVVAHGEGRAEFAEAYQPQQLNQLVALRYLDYQGQPTLRYPANPNGSPLGITGLTTLDGRFTIMMPHPERVFLRYQYAWLPREWQSKEGPWMQLFWNARRWLK